MKGCHRLGPAGTRKVENRTLNDIQMYRTRDCKDPDPIYIATNTTNEIVPGSLPWRSYSVVY